MLSASTPLKGLTNIGPTIAARLKEVGVSKVGDLRRVGPAGAFQMVKARSPDKSVPVCYYLYSLQGALDGKHWDALSELKKRALLKQAEKFAIDRSGETLTASS